MSASTLSTRPSIVLAATSAASERRQFEVAVRPMMPDLLRYFARRVDPTEDAADCLSETLIVLWKKRRDLPVGSDQLRAWSFGVARHVLQRQHRGKLRHHRIAGEMRDEISHAPQVDADRALDVRQALAQLRPLDRELITLIHWDGLGIAEAGAALGLKPSAARMRYSRLRLKLADQLG